MKLIKHIVRYAVVFALLLAIVYGLGWLSGMSVDEITTRNNRMALAVGFSLMAAVLVVCAWGEIESGTKGNSR